jgi:aryl-alcohol dehydrogenase-like predicted oxidoreductase
VKMRRLGRDGPLVSAIGLGCMRMSNIMGGPQPEPDSDSDSESIATIEAALDAGITLLNTGDFYGMGHNEALIARAIRHRRDQAFLSAKCGILRTHTGKILGMDGRPSAIKNYAAYSLQRLGVEYIDLFQPARADPSVPYEETIGAVADLIGEGKVRYLGVSEIDADQLCRAHSTHPVTALEIEYSLASRFIEREMLPVARELGVGVVAYGVVTQGLLAGAMQGGVVEGTLASSFPRFQGENLRKNLETVSLLERLAQSKHRTPAQLAIAWVLSRGDDIVPLIGMSRRSRLPENLGALDVTLSAEELAELDQAFAPGAIAGSRS